MRSALYYPHTNVRNEGLIKTALLLWDRLEYIVPWPDFRARYPNRRLAKAMDIIGAAHCPNDDEKQEMHLRLGQFLNRRLPPQLYFRRQRRNPDGPHFQEPYEMYPQKLLPDSWRLLQEARIAGKRRDSSDYPLSESGGLTVMFILADCCAGTTRSRVTDRGDAYATVAGFIGNNPDGPKITKADAHGLLVPISLNVIDASNVGIDTLLKLREREEKESGHTLRNLRHRYVDGLETYASRLANEKATKADAREIRRQFADDMKADFKDLRAELGFAGKEALLSSAFIATVLAAVGSTASWLFGASVPLEGVVTAAGVPARIGGILGVRNKYLKERRAILKQHPMAYLYEAGVARAAKHHTQS
jgi:hypothetical protein